MVYSSFNNSGLVKVLYFLKSHDTEYLSGQDLSDVLKISRVAVWKHIKKIKELGYEIETNKKLGYRLKTNTEKLLPWEITEELKTRLIGKHAYYFESIDSTQNQALSMASDRNNNGIVIVAEKQNSGRGRIGRKWESPRGGIWFSVILHPKFDIAVATLFPLAAALALSKAIEKTMNIKTELKWPNDVTIEGKKVAGILVDVTLESNKIEEVVLGVGINFAVKSKQIEEVFKENPNFYGAASLSERNKETRPIELLRSFLRELDEIYFTLNAAKTKQIIIDWTKRSSTIGKEVQIITENEKIRGKAIKIDTDGALVVSEGNRNKRIVAGDVLHI